MSGLEQVAQWVTIVGAPCAVMAIIFAGIQIRQSVLIARGQFMLELERMIALHDPVHIRLRPGGDWSTRDGGPEDTAEWIALEDYMGFFEHCELLLQTRSLKLKSFRALFGYRVENIMANERIVQAKLLDEDESWNLFLELLDRLGSSRSSGATNMTFSRVTSQPAEPRDVRP